MPSRKLLMISLQNCYDVCLHLSLERVSRARGLTPRVAADAARSWPGASAPRASSWRVSVLVASGTGRAAERVERWADATYRLIMFESISSHRH